MIDKNTLYREDGLTSDGYFMIKSELEPKSLQKKATAEINPHLQDYFTRIVADAETELQQPEAYHNTDTTLQLWKLTDGGKATYIQKGFLRYFGTRKNLTYYQHREAEFLPELQPIVVKRKNEVLGLIMPVRMEDK